MHNLLNENIDESKLYNLSNNKSITLTKEKDITILYFNKEEKVIVFKTWWEYQSKVHIVNIETGKETIINEQKYSGLFTVSDDKYIASI